MNSQDLAQLEDDDSPSRLTTTRDEEIPPDSLTGMFAQLLSEMQNISSGIAFLNDAREKDEEALLNNDDDVDEEDDERQERDADVASLDTRADKLVTGIL